MVPAKVQCEGIVEDGCGLNMNFVGVVEIDLILVIDCCVPGIGKFAATEQRLCEVWNNVNLVCGGTDIKQKL